MQRLFEEARSQCPTGLWTRGVKLAREASVSVEQAGQEELVLRVKSPGRVLAPTVVLYPEDLEWTCDCGNAADACEHVAAAVIFVTQTLASGKLLAAQTSAVPRLEYHFTREKPQRLRLKRVLRGPGPETRPLEGSLSSAVTRGKLGFEPSQDDLEIDRILEADRRGELLPRTLSQVLSRLDGREGIELDGVPVKVHGQPLLPRVSISDRGPDVVVAISQAASLTELLAQGVALCGDSLRPLGALETTGYRLEHLPHVRSFKSHELGELVQKLLPELESKFEVEIKTQRLPRRGARLKPRIMFDLSHEGHSLSVLPLLVYGNPPEARVDAGRLVHLTGRVPERDISAEQELVFALRDQLNLVPGRRVDFDGEAAQRFAARLRTWQTTQLDDTLDGIVHDRALSPRIVLDEQHFDIWFELSEDSNPRAVLTSESLGDGDGKPGVRASGAAVLQAFRDGLDLVPLMGGGWAPLPVDWLARYGATVLDLLAARDEKQGLLKHAFPTLKAFCAELDISPPKALSELEPLFRDFEKLPEAPLPEDLTAVLRPYQRQGVNWLGFLRSVGLSAVLADDMGLGKTLQTLCAIRGRTLVVCPRSVIHNWANEAQRFRPGLKVGLYHGPGRRLDPHADLTLTTYAVLRLDIETLSEIAWDSVVLDEAQAIKNPDSQVSRAAFQLQAAFRIALSGTPVENRLEELWSLFHFTHRGLLGGRSDFQERYAAPINRGETPAIDRLRALTRPFLLRRLKRSVAPELPPRTDAVLSVELSDEERRIYDAVHAATRDEVLTALADGGSVLLALEALLRLRQAACHAALLPGQKAESSSKVEALVEALGDAALDGHKALVFSQWTSLLDLIQPELSREGIEFCRLDGTTRDRAAVVDNFQNASGPPVMLASLKAGGTGLNLTAADHVFLLDPWWNPAAEDQAADRAHRIGQERPVTVYRLVAKDTVEERILDMQKQKRLLSEAALEGSHGAAQLSREDLMALLE